jgi:hypothetical protein
MMQRGCGGAWLCLICILAVLPGSLAGAEWVISERTLNRLEGGSLLLALRAPLFTMEHGETRGFTMNAMIHAMEGARVREDAQYVSEPLDALIVDRTFWSEVATATADELSVSPLIAVQAVDVQPLVVGSRGTSRELARLPGNRVALLVPRISLTSDLRSLQVRVIASLYRTGGRNATVIYRRTFLHSSAPIGPGSRSALLAFWQLDEGEQLRTRIRNSMTEIGELLSADLLGELDDGSVDMTEFTIDTGNAVAIWEARVLRQWEDRVVLEADDHRIESWAVRGLRTLP